MLPMAAFGAGAAYTTASSTVSPKSLSLDVYAVPDDLGKITLTFKDGTTAVAKGNTVEFYIKSDRDAEIGYVYGEDGAHSFTGTDLGKGDGKGIAVEALAGGKVEVYVGSKISGSFKLSFYNLPALDDDARLIDSVTATVSVGDGNVVLYAKNEDNTTGGGGIYDNPRAFDASAANITIDKDGSGDPVVAAGEGVELEAVVEDGGIALEDKEVTFQYRFNNGSWFTLATEVTDDEGIATYYVEQTKPGTYEYRASIGSASADKSKIIKMVVAPDFDRAKGVHAVKTIELSTADGAKVAQKANNNIDFLIKDQYGNLVKSFADSDFEVEFASTPAGSKFQDKEWTAGGHGSHADVNTTAMADGKVRIAFTPDKLGSYTIKIRNAFEKRVSATITVEAIDFEKAASLKFVLKNVASPAETVTSLVRVGDTNVYGNDENQVAGQLLIYRVSADGAELKIDNGDGLTISSPDSKIVVDSSQDGNYGKITIKKDAAGTYPLTVYYATDNIVATYDLLVVGSPRSLAVTPTVTGTSAAVAIQYIDSNGNNTFSNINDEAFSVSVPAGVSATNFKNINKKGAGSFELTAAEPGTYTVTVITSNKKIAKSFDITFGPNVGDKPAYGAEKVTMFIGATGYVSDGAPLVTDVAPFIVDGRTFVAVRPVADAFGCEIGWNEATQTVTLTRADKVVTIVIGSNVITVVEGGVTTTVTADVAAFIKDGRTVLPFRAVGDAFGATVEYDATTQAVTYEQ